MPVRDAVNPARMFHVLATVCHNERPLSRPATVKALFDWLKPTTNIFTLPSPPVLQEVCRVYWEFCGVFLLRRLTSEDLRGWYL